MPTKTRKVNKANSLTGSSLDDFLRDEGILEEVEAAALKRVMAVLEDVDDLAVVAKRSRPTKPTTSLASALLTRSEIESLKRGKKRISDYALKEFQGWKAEADKLPAGG
jgi:hypothetical protein